MHIHHSFFLKKSAKCLLKCGLCSVFVFFFTSFPNAAEMAYIVFKNEKKKICNQSASRRTSMKRGFGWISEKH